MLENYPTDLKREAYIVRQGTTTHRATGVHVLLLLGRREDCLARTMHAVQLLPPRLKDHFIYEEPGQ